MVFRDSDCKFSAGNVLYEGRKYYLVLPTQDERLIRASLESSGIAEFVSWNRLNPIATLQVVNRIGLVNLFGARLDIRSEKFLEAETGDRQFKIVLDDLAALSRQVLFDNSAAPSAHRTHDPRASRASLLERFNYYRQTCRATAHRIGLEALVDYITRNPHSILEDEHIRDHIWNVRKASQRSLRSFFRHNQTFVRLPDDHHLTASRPGLRDKSTGSSLFPLTAMRSRGKISVDTPENRFVKHVLLDIEAVCAEVSRHGLVTGALLVECRALSSTCRALLRRPLFAEVGQIQAVPTSSPTLLKRHGYRQLYAMFVRSRVGARHLFEDLAEESLHIELKDISLLYEYWVFYKIVAKLLGPGSIYASRECVVKNGKIVNGAVVTNGVFNVHFNRTFTRSPQGSYSLRLRPDVVVQKCSHGGQAQPIYVMDAKYRSVDQTATDEPDPLVNAIRAVTTADVHKMHCYADAIEGVVSAVAIYPGTKFYFYPRDRTSAPLSAGRSMETIRGVGAVPLLPGSASADFDAFLTAEALVSSFGH